MNIPPTRIGVSRQGKVSVLATGLVVASFGMGDALAQVQPDAGSIQQELERGRVPGMLPSLPPAPVVEELAKPALPAPDGMKFFVKGFRITRNTAFTEDELLALVKNFAGKEQSFAELELATDVITRFYRDHDFFVARAYVPVQLIQDGIVEITVLEGLLDRFNQKSASGVRVKEIVVEDTLRAALPAEELIRLEKLERGLLLLNDIPGVDVQSLLQPGSKLGSSLVIVEVNEGPLVNGNLDIDNHGSKYTGPFRLGGTINLNDATGYGDHLNLRATASAFSSYARLAYQIPIGASGFRLGGAYAETRYKLCCDFSPLQASGEAQTNSLHAIYPFLRGRDTNLYGTVTYDARHYFNTALAIPLSNKDAKVAGIGLNGNIRDLFGAGGVSNLGMHFTAGKLDLDGWAPDRATDAASVQTHGVYGKTAYYMSHLQRLGETTTLYAGYTGQFASKNLDSSEKFNLGGPYGVRSYPQGEAAGDEGLLLNLELRYYFMPTLEFTTFIDYGEVRLHKNEWAGWQGANTHISNRYGLSGFGFALNWHTPGAFIRASVAQPIGENPGRNPNDNDADNTQNRLRLWLQAVKYF